MSLKIDLSNILKLIIGLQKILFSYKKPSFKVTICLSGCNFCPFGVQKKPLSKLILRGFSCYEIQIGSI
jgi:hypothetical protein